MLACPGRGDLGRRHVAVIASAPEVRYHARQARSREVDVELHTAARRAVREGVGAQVVAYDIQLDPRRRDHQEVALGDIAALAVVDMQADAVEQLLAVALKLADPEGHAPQWVCAAAAPGAVQ